MQTDKEKAILEITEEMVRQGGYNGFSFRNIASAVGIKSSSVHYHFATKEDLAVAVTEYYSTRFLASLGDPKKLKADGENPIIKYINAFRNAWLEDKGMCLCGMLGAESEILPERVVAQTQQFFQDNIDWLERAFAVTGYVGDKRVKAIQTLSVLEGAMLISKTHKDLDMFDYATRLLKNEMQ